MLKSITKLNLRQKKKNHKNKIKGEPQSSYFQQSSVSKTRQTY